jgi:hypothetical protein
LTSTELIGTVHSWNEVLDSVPADWLNELYKRAMRARTKSGPLQPGELAAIWSEVNATGEATPHNQAAAQSAAERCPEFECSVEGWVVVDGRGAMAVSNHGGVTYVRRCPIHWGKETQ